MEVEGNKFSIKQEAKHHEVYAIILDTQSKAYTDLTGPFPYKSTHINGYIFVLYTYDLNGILMECMKNRGDAEVERVLENIMQGWKKLASNQQ